MVTTKSVEEIVSDVKVKFVQNIEGFNDMNVGSALDMFTTALAEELNLYYGQLQTLENNAFVDTSTGTYLDQLGSEAGVPRKTGELAEGLITFYRTTPASSDFTITAGSQISTQPNTSETQYVFQTLADATFTATVSGETKTFKNGIYDYKLGRRLVNSVTSLTGTASSVAKTFVLNTDFQLVSVTNSDIVDSTTLTLIDNCDATTGWAASGSSSTTPYLFATKYEGVYSLSLDKNLTTSAIANFYKTIVTKDLSAYKSYVYVYIADVTTLNKIKYVYAYLGNSGVSNAFRFTFPKSQLTTGWNKLSLDYLNNATLLGLPNIGTVNYIQMSVETNNTSDTFTSNLLAMDFWYTANVESYSGNIIRFLTSGTLPDNATTITSSYVPLSIDILCDAVEVGAGYNVTQNKINYKISNLVNVDNVNNYVSLTGAVNIETDDEYRLRIQAGSSIADVSTISAIKSNIEALSYVESASISDLPTVSVANEAMVFYTAI